MTESQVYKMALTRIAVGRECLVAKMKIAADALVEGEKYANGSVCSKCECKTKELPAGSD